MTVLPNAADADDDYQQVDNLCTIGLSLNSNNTDVFEFIFK